MADLAEQKQRIRTEMLARRRSLSAEEVTAAGAALCHVLEGYLRGREDSPVLAYWEVRQELPLSPWITSRMKEGRGVYLPKVAADRGGRQMDFYFVDRPDLLRRGAYGILEPDPALCGKLVPDRAVSPVVLVPGVAFDRKGSRLGHGAGYYDRYLDRLPGCTKAGICYSWQILDFVPAEDTDIKMHEILTDGGIVHVQ